MQKIPSAQRIWLGRSSEMSELLAGIAALASGRGSVFLLTGEAGIGKTRLADEAGRAAAERGVAVHWGRAWEAGGAPAYWPFIQALRTMPGDGAALLAARASTPVERFELFESVGAFLREAAATPRLLVLDDLHAADPSSLSLLHFVVRDLRARPLMIIGTYREAEARIAPEIGRLLALVAREATVLPLPRLGREDIAAFVSQATGAAPSNERLAAIVEQTEGNPLFLRELLQLHGGELRRTEGIREVVRARLALLPAESRSALEAAAAIGREFEVEPLARVIGCTEVDVRSLLEPAADAGIVEAILTPPRWRFTHVLLREGLYDAIAAERRSALHRAAAEALRKEDRPSELAIVAHHLLRAVPLVSARDAAVAAIAAAQAAMNVLAFEDARALFTSADKLLEGAAGDERMRFDALYGIGHSFMRAGEVDEGKRAFARAAALARSVSASDLLARAALGAAYEHSPDVRDDAMVAALEEALAALPEGDGALRAACMAQLAGRRQLEPDPAPQLALVREAVAMARRVGDRDALRATLTAATSAMALADPKERELLDREVLGLALAAGDERVAQRSHMLLGADLICQGDLEGATQHMRASEAILEKLPHNRFRWLIAAQHAIEALVRGRLDEALRDFAEAEAAMAHDESRGSALVGAALSVACVVERYDDAAALETRTRAAFAAAGHELGVCLGEMFIAKLHARAGNRERTAAQLAAVAALPIFHAIREPSWLALLAEACLLASDAPLAERLHAALLPQRERFLFLGPLSGCVEPPVSRQLGLAAQALGRHDDAVRDLDDALGRTERAGMRAHLARLRFELADALVARAADGDRDRAASLASSARALATELGQAGLLRRFGDGPSEAVESRSSESSPARPHFTIARQGESWCVQHGERTAMFRDGRGMQLLALLVQNRGRELHVLELSARDEGAVDTGDAGPLLDAPAVCEYRDRLLALREELEEAEQWADKGRAEKLKGEHDALTSELARAVGLGGKERRAGGAAERARTAVQKRVREAIRRIETELPELGRHLDQTVRTGAFCGYLPDGRAR
jgi:tetratricopeptide (TPR) repeat protein